MKIIKKGMRLLRIFLFAFLFAFCMVMGIVPVIPKRKEQCEMEIKMEDTGEEMEIAGRAILNNEDCG